MSQFESKIVNLFRNFQWMEGTSAPVLFGQLPDEIMLEMERFTVICKEIKQHPLYFLRNHKNVGNNKFQVSVPAPELENSFTLAYLVNLGMYFFHKIHGEPFEALYRKIKMRCIPGHFDTYDLWINFIEPGDINEWHNHAGCLSGVIYMDNDINIPTKFEDGSSYNGKKGDVILFPSQLMHRVDRNETNSTRITYAFNLALTSSPIT